MLARYLRYIYLTQFLTGALLGTWGAMAMAPHWGAGALALVLLGGFGWILFWQVVIIGWSMITSRADGPLWPWLQAAWGELQAAVRVFGLRMPWVKQNPGILLPTGTAAAGPTALPVLLVHGFVCNHRVWDKVVPALRQSGHPVLAVDLEPLFTSIDDYAALLERAVQDLRSQTGAPQVVLVGHSMGGLAIRAWLRAYGAAQAARIITLGTPHQGTRAPQWVSTPNGQQMAWRSAWLADLSASETPAKRQLMKLALTAHDNIVHPQRAQMLESANVTEFSGIGHLQMCLDDRVIRWLLQHTTASH